MPISLPAKHSDEINRSVEMEADMPPTLNEADTNNKKMDSKTESEKDSVSPRKRKSLYKWRVVSFSSCSKSCGGGMLTPIIRCVRESSSKFYAHKRCGHQTKPTLEDSVLKCNTQPCPAYWRIDPDEWTACNCGKLNEFHLFLLKSRTKDK